jgi:hypothetical protein
MVDLVPAGRGIRGLGRCGDEVVVGINPVSFCKPCIETALRTQAILKTFAPRIFPCSGSGIAGSRRSTCLIAKGTSSITCMKHQQGAIEGDATGRCRIPALWTCAGPGIAGV